MRLTAICIAAAMLAACGGGGGGSNIRPGVLPPSFADVRPGETLAVNGDDALLQGTRDANGVTAVQNPHGGVGTAEVRLGFDASRSLESVSITTTPGSATPTIAFNRSTDAFACASSACAMQNAAAQAVVIDPVAAGWNYQTYGAWLLLDSPTTSASATRARRARCRPRARRASPAARTAFT
jgi:hypothetical protein